MSPEQKEKALEITKASMNMIAALWRSGKGGKIVIIAAAAVILGIFGQMFGGGDTASGAENATAETVKAAAANSDSAEQKSDDPLEVDKSYLKNASEDTAKPNNEVVPVIKGTSIMTIARDTDKWSKEYKELRAKYRNDMGLQMGNRRLLEKLYNEGFYTPVTHEKAKVDPSKPRFSLFGGTLKIGDAIDLPEEIVADDSKFEFFTEYAGKQVMFKIDMGITPIGAHEGNDIVPHRFPDGSQVWTMSYDIKGFMGLTHAVTEWYRDSGSNKLVMFWAEVKNRDAGDSKRARETRQRLETAIKGKYPDMEKTYHDKITEEYMLNGDILELMQSPVPKEGGWLDAPYVKVSMITPSIVAKLLAVIDDMIKQDFESFKKKEAGALDGF